VSAWHLYPVRLQLEHLRTGRAKVCRALRAESIGVNVHYDWRTLAPAFERMLGSLRVRPELTTLNVSVPA
jgi:dTDP-4-amino-4,6-dideoxygalactose transaminase